MLLKLVEILFEEKLETIGIKQREEDYDLNALKI